MSLKETIDIINQKGTIKFVMLISFFLVGFSSIIIVASPPLLWIAQIILILTTIFMGIEIISSKGILNFHNDVMSMGYFMLAITLLLFISKSKAKECKQEAIQRGYWWNTN